MITYLASPYTHPDPQVMEERFNDVCQYAAELMREGLHVYSPIAHCHPIAQHGLPKDWDFWQEMDRKFIAASGMMIVYMLDGWRESKGVIEEVGIAQALNIPIKYDEHRRDEEC